MATVPRRAIGYGWRATNLHQFTNLPPISTLEWGSVAVAWLWSINLINTVQLGQTVGILITLLWKCWGVGVQPFRGGTESTAKIHGNQSRRPNANSPDQLAPGGANYGADNQLALPKLHCVQKKNTHSHFLSYLHEWCVDLNKNCSEYTQLKVGSDNVEIRYSLRPMTWLWRHICLAKVGASLQYAISHEPMISFCEYRYFLVRRCGHIVYYVVKFKTIFNNFSFINQIKFDRQWCEIKVTATECCGWLMQIHICVKEKSGYFERNLWHLNSSVTK